MAGFGSGGVGIGLAPKASKFQMGKVLGPGPMMKPVIPPRGSCSRRVKKPVRFIVERAMLASGNV